MKAKKTSYVTINNENSINDLYRRVVVTSKTRFHASRRLRSHSKYSTYIIVLISLGLILISLMQTFNLGDNIRSNLVSLIQVFSAVAILVYSLLIDKHDYSNRSEKMYSCGSKLAEFRQKIHPHIDEEHNEDQYVKFCEEYNGIIDLYETHSNNDFRGDYDRAKLEMPEFYNINCIGRFFDKVYVHLRYWLDFLQYIAVIVILGVILYWLWFGFASKIS